MPILAEVREELEMMEEIKTGRRGKGETDCCP